MIHHAADMPAPDAGFNRLVAIVTRDGVLDPEAIMVCEPHGQQSDDPGCKYAPVPRPSGWQRTRDWFVRAFDWLLEVTYD